jgi:hypothetical protein
MVAAVPISEDRFDRNAIRAIPVAAHGNGPKFPSEKAA